VLDHACLWRPEHQLVLRHHWQYYR